MRCRTKLSWHLAKSFHAARQGSSLSTATFPLPAPHPGCFAASGPGLSRRRLLRLAKQRLLHVIVFCLNYVYLGRAPTNEELGRHPNGWQTKCFAHLRSLLVVCGDGQELFPMVPGRSGPELGATLFQLESFVTKHPDLGAGYVAHEPRIFEEDQTLLDVAKHPELRPYKNLDPSRLKIVGDGRWPLADFLEGPLWLPYVEPRFLWHGADISEADLPAFKSESRLDNLQLCKLWDAKGLLKLFRQPQQEGHFSRVFNAHKSEVTDRQIGDRRIPNARERGIDGPSAQLPPGFMLTSIRIEPYTEQLRASITDRRDYYHQARVSDERAQSNMLPFAFTEAELGTTRALEAAKQKEGSQRKRPVRGVNAGDGFGAVHVPAGCPDKWYPAFGSLFQGDHLGVEFALQAHEGLLLQAGLLEPSSRIRGHSPFPLGDRFEGLIIDDYFAIGAEKLGTGSLNSFSARALSKARKAYDDHCLPGSVEKDIESACFFKAAGAEINSTRKAVDLGLTTIGAPLGKRLALAALSLRAARLPSTTAKLLSRLAGSWTSVLLYRRCLNCVVDDVYKLAAEAEAWGSNFVLPLPRKVASELTLLSVFAPVLVTNAAVNYASRIFASDASLAKGAVVSRSIPEEVSKIIWLGSDKKGAHARLVEGPKAALTALGQELADDVRVSECDRVDSSSPSRPLLLSFDFVEIYGGSGRVSKAATDLGLVVAPPLDLDASCHYNLAEPRLIEWIMHMIEVGRFRSFLSEPPCTTFSPAAHPALRGYDVPLGYDPSEPRTRTGTLLAFRSFLLLRHGRRHGRPCGKEQPRLSKMRWLKAWQQLLSLDFTESVIASCQFGSPHKKEFIFVTWGLDGQSLDVRCPGGHEHLVIQGAYTKASAVYTWDLARHLAAHFARALRRIALTEGDISITGYESPLINDVLATGSWSEERVWGWKTASHINVLEGNAGHGILGIAAQDLRSCRFACILDSRVAKGALAKGRSSAVSLQRVCKKAGALQLAADLYPGWCFGPTRLNVADDPTRDVRIRAPSSFSLIHGFGNHDLQRIHSLALSRPAANLLRLVLLYLLLNPCKAFGEYEALQDITGGRALFGELDGFGQERMFLRVESGDRGSVSASTCSLAQCISSFSQKTWPGFSSWIFIWIFPWIFTWIFAWISLWIFISWTYHTRLLRLCLVLSCLIGPQGFGFRRVGFGCVVASAMEPLSAAERERAAQRRGGSLVATRVARKATIDAREKLLNDFRSWLWLEHGVQLSILLTSKPPDPEEICKWLVCYGQEMYQAGKAYGKYAETINAVATVRPAVRKMLAPAWDLAFAWLEDEPYQHHQAMPISIMISMMTVALLWGWPLEAAIIGMTWCGILRIGETLMSSRADLVLPEDAAPGTDFALLRIKFPKTRGRAARHQAARIDPPDLIQLLSAVFGRLSEETKLWPFAASTLRKRFNSLLSSIGLPTTRTKGGRPFDLGSLRPGGATFLLLASENSEHVRRRGRWVTTKVCEIYLQETMYTTYTTKLPAETRVRIEQLAKAFPETLQVALGFLRSGIPAKTWHKLYQARDSQEHGVWGKSGRKCAASPHTNGPAADGPEWQQGTKEGRDA